MMTDEGLKKTKNHNRDRKMEREKTQRRIMQVGFKERVSHLLAVIFFRELEEK